MFDNLFVIYYSKLI